MRRRCAARGRMLRRLQAPALPARVNRDEAPALPARGRMLRRLQAPALPASGRGFAAFRLTERRSPSKVVVPSTVHTPHSTLPTPHPTLHTHPCSLIPVHSSLFPHPSGAKRPLNLKQKSPRARMHEDFTGDPVGIRTPNLLIRSQMLYPIELQSQPFSAETGGKDSQLPRTSKSRGDFHADPARQVRS